MAISPWNVNKTEMGTGYSVFHRWFLGVCVCTNCKCAGKHVIAMQKRNFLFYSFLFFCYTKSCVFFLNESYSADSIL